MAYKTDEIRGYVQDPISITGEVGGEVLYEKIKENLSLSIQNNNIPAIIKDDILKSGGFFGTKVPLLVIKNTTPNCRFFDIGISVNGNTISFILLGESAENTKNNKKNYYKENGNYLMTALIRVDELKLQQEALWRNSVIESFNSLLF